MSKYDALWQYIVQRGQPSLVLTFDEAREAGGVEIDHSFLRYKKELLPYGYSVGKISLKEKTAAFHRVE